MGAPPAPEVFNCSAPDTGNMEVLVRYGTDAEEALARAAARRRDPLRFAMTEPGGVVGRHQHRGRIERDGDHYVINGRKWWSSVRAIRAARCPSSWARPTPTHHCTSSSRRSGAARCRGNQDRAEAEGVRLRRCPARPSEVEFKNVEVPVSNMLLGEGRGFEIAQGRLGPGRIHHCMRLIGLAERAHGVMDAARSPGGLRDLEAASASSMLVTGTSTFSNSTSASSKPNTGSQRTIFTPLASRGMRVTDLLLVAVGIAHENDDIAAPVRCARREPLVAVDDVLIAVTHRFDFRSWWRHWSQRRAPSCKRRTDAPPTGVPATSSLSAVPSRAST